MHDALYREVGKRVKTAREAAKLTQESLANRLALKRTSVTNIESGRQKLLVHTLVQLADALQVPIETLVPPPGDSSRDLGALLKQRPQDEQAWVRAVLSSSSEK